MLSSAFFSQEWRHVSSSKSGKMGVPLSESIRNPFPLWRCERSRAGKNPNSLRTWHWMNSEALVTTFLLLTEFPPVLIFCLRGSLGIQTPSRCLWKLKLLFWATYIPKQAILLLTLGSLFTGFNLSVFITRKTTHKMGSWCNSINPLVRGTRTGKYRSVWFLLDSVSAESFFQSSELYPSLTKL